MLYTVLKLPIVFGLQQPNSYVTMHTSTNFCNGGFTKMSNSIDRSIRSAELSLQMEGFSVSPICKDLCRKLLSGEITLEQYLARVMPDRKKD